MTPPTRSTKKVEERAGLFFLLYAQLGPSRSLERVRELAAEAGIAVSLTTLKRYSSKNQWVQRVLEVDAQAAAAHHARAVESLSAGLERHAQLGRAFQRLAAGAAEVLLQDRTRLGSSSLAGVARAGQIGAQLERGAASEQRDRAALALEIWNLLIIQLVDGFLELNDLDDPQARVERFTELVDGLIDRTPPGGRRCEPLMPRDSNAHGSLRDQ